MIGKLIKKVGGYGKEVPLVGIAIEEVRCKNTISPSKDPRGAQMLVYTDGELEYWYKKFCEVINESR